jgi:hypothetical protein
MVHLVIRYVEQVFTIRNNIERYVEVTGITRLTRWARRPSRCILLIVSIQLILSNSGRRKNVSS